MIIKKKKIILKKKVTIQLNQQIISILLKLIWIKLTQQIKLVLIMIQMINNYKKIKIKTMHPKTKINLIWKIKKTNKIKKILKKKKRMRKKIRRKNLRRKRKKKNNNNQTNKTKNRKKSINNPHHILFIHLQKLKKKFSKIKNLLRTLQQMKKHFHPVTISKHCKFLLEIILTLMY